MTDLLDAISTAFILVARFDADLVEIVGLSLAVSLSAVAAAIRAMQKRARMIQP